MEEKQCPNCSYKSRFAYNLRSHLSRIHPEIPIPLELQKRPIEENQHECDECGRKYKQRRGLMEHQRQAHPHLKNSTPYVVECALCENVAKSHHDLVVHSQIAHQTENKRYFYSYNY